MEPITIATAATIIKALGVDKALGRWIAGDKGAEVAGKVMDAAQVVTGARSAQDIVATIEQDSQAANQLRERMLELAEAEAQREAQDRENARAMQQTALGQEDKFSKRFVYYFAAAWSVFAMAYLLLITLVDIPAENQRFADTILGFLLGTIIAGIVQFFFGSSKGSQSKDSSLAGLVDAVRAKVRG